MDAVRVIEDAPQVARRGTDPLVSAEVVVIAALPLRDDRAATPTCRCAACRRASLAVRSNVRVVRGRFVEPGLYEIVVGKNAAGAYAGLDLGGDGPIGPGTWTVVGVFDAGGSAFDSEIWADANVLNANYQRPPASTSR